MAIIEFSEVSKAYSENVVLDKFSLAIEQGEVLVLLGPSGCGKTTILKMINGLLIPDSGEINVKSKPINEYDLIELRRGIGYVIQQIGLLPHLTVEDNICFVLDLLKRPEPEKKSVAKELIKLVGMDESMLRRYPKELSGGQQQRVGVARALAANPEIILMDEPFGAVDEITRRNLQDELIKIHSKLKKTIIFVTHDIEEAIKLGTRIVLLNNGVIERNEKKRDFVLLDDRSEYAKKFFESKDFMAYLNTIKIKDLVIKQLDISFDLYDSSSLVKYDSTVLQGIQKSIEVGKETILTVDEENNPYGWFSLTEIYKKLNS
ncbi:ABC transporter ATP-binding protein [Acetoanaerobium sticklandii]|uniref:ABC transporter ATP-binding protein n=1 Tax=Acetoanaerobium sticklandii TaxID=1511 RepID=UPI003A9559A4